MKRYFLISFLLTLFSCATIPSSENRTISYNENREWVLSWSEEFNTNGLPDSKIWSYDVGGNGWGNNELQYYTKERLENVRVENGGLIIEAKKENFEGKKYTSTRLVTRDKKSILYGRVEVSAKLPQGKGTWPGIWMVGQNKNYVGWPLCGEIDIMEHVGFDPNRIHGSVHTKAYNHNINTQKTTSRIINDVFDQFHTYAIEWTPNQVDFFIDKDLYFTFKKETNTDDAKWPFNKPQYIILNIAVGGNWGGEKGVDDAVFPAKMEIDYIRVYKQK